MTAAVSVTLLFPVGGWAPSFIAAAFPAVFILSAARQLKGTPQFAMRPEAARARSEGRTGQAHELAREAGADLTEQPTPLAAALRSHRWFPSGLSLLGAVPAPQRSFATIIAIYRPGLFVLIGPSAALLFLNDASFPAHTRATGGSILNASGPIGALIADAGITASLAFGAGWGSSAFIWGCVPILLSGLVILGARSVDPKAVRSDPRSLPRRN